MLKLSFSDLINSIEALSALSREKFPVKLSYQLSKMLKSCEKESIYFDELRKKKIDELEIPIKNNSYDIPPEKIESYRLAMDEISKIEVEIFGDKLDIDQLGDIKFEAGYLSKLNWLFI